MRIRNTLAPAAALALLIGFLAWQAPAALSQSASPQDRHRHEPKGPVRQQPQALDPSQARIGEMVDDFEFVDLDGRKGRLHQFRSSAAIVIILRDVDCPVGKRYGNTLGRLSREYSKRGVRFIFLNVNRADAPDSMQAERREFGLGGFYAADHDRKVARLLGAASTTEAFLLDSALTLHYRGAVDDQYGIGFSRKAPRNTYLRTALESVLAGTEVEVAATTAPGCYLDLKAATTAAKADYSSRISRIIQRNCLSCHRSGGSAPFQLATYEQVKSRAGIIEYVVEEGIMPPWFADHGSGPWANDRSLSSRDRKAILQWIEEGTPEGDPQHLPKPRRWASGWTIGQPDAVIEIPEPIRVPAEGVMDYIYVYAKTDFPEDRWVQRMEILPTAPQAVHHVLIFIEEPGRSRGRRGLGPRFQTGAGGYFASTVPGQQAALFPQGMAKLLPKGAWLKFQLHYTPNGTELVDRTRLGLVFADAAPERLVRTAGLSNWRFEIPPGAANYPVSASHRLRRDLVLLSFFPHMHLRGKAFKYEVTYPDGRHVEVLPISRYDFNWQLHYQLETPLHLPAGTILKATGWFDNSPDNPANPDPERTVLPGEQTYDEMMIGYFDWHAPASNSKPNRSTRPGGR